MMEAKPRATGPSWAAFADIRRQHLALYRERADMIRREFGSVDGLLYRGGLETGAAEKELGLATGEPTRTTQPWGVLYVRALNNKSMWPGRKVLTSPNWASESARAFLEVSAEIGSSIHFTW